MRKTFFILAGLAWVLAQGKGHAMPKSRVEWAGAYLNGSKVGWSLFAFGCGGDYPEILTESNGFAASAMGEGAPVLLSRSSLRVRAYGLPNQLEWNMEAVLFPNLTLRRLEFHLNSDDSTIRLSGEVEGNHLLVSILSASSESKQQIPLDGNGVYIAEVIPLLLSESINQGKDPGFDLRVFEPHQLSCSTWKIRSEGTEWIDSIGGRIQAHRVTQEIGGFNPVLWIDDEGRVYKEWAPLSKDLGYLSLQESEEQARDSTFINPILSQPDVPAASTQPTPDLLDATRVRVKKRIPDPDRVTRMVVDLWNFELDQPIPEGRWQTNLARYPKSAPTSEIPLRLEIVSPDIRSIAAQSENGFSGEIPQEIQPFLEKEPLVQVDHPEIKKLAQEITEGSSSPWEKSVAIYRWIEGNIQTEFRITLPSALEVLKTGKGDCNEQSTLFAALARAAGVPTKICTGLVYQGSGFYYHAWNEVLVSTDPETWVPIDPALKEIRVDATHIKFGEGGLSTQSYLNGLIGKIQARVIEFERDDPDPESSQTLRTQDSG